MLQESRVGCWWWCCCYRVAGWRRELARGIDPTPSAIGVGLDRPETKAASPRAHAPSSCLHAESEVRICVGYAPRTRGAPRTSDHHKDALDLTLVRNPATPAENRSLYGSSRRTWCGQRLGRVKPLPVPFRPVPSRNALRLRSSGTVQVHEPFRFTGAGLDRSGSREPQAERQGWLVALAQPTT